jgi:hypothetical protein
LSLLLGKRVAGVSRKALLGCGHQLTACLVVVVVVVVEVGRGGSGVAGRAAGL